MLSSCLRGRQLNDGEALADIGVGAKAVIDVAPTFIPTMETGIRNLGNRREYQGRDIRFGLIFEADDSDLNSTWIVILTCPKENTLEEVIRHVNNEYGSKLNAIKPLRKCRLKIKGIKAECERTTKIGKLKKEETVYVYYLP